MLDFWLVRSIEQYYRAGSKAGFFYLLHKKIRKEGRLSSIDFRVGKRA